MKDKILIVEDSKTYIQVIIELLKEYTEFDFILATSYKEAKEILEKDSEIFASLLDLHLPDAMSGEIVNLALEHKIPSIVLTADVSESIRLKFNDEPIVDYIIKESIDDIRGAIELLNKLKLNESINVLIVDDSRVFRSYIKSFLKLHRFNIIEAEHGLEALEILKNQKIQLIITDYYMPHLDGYEFIRKVRRKFSKEDICILALSSENNSYITSKFLKNGANDYIIKGFSKDEFFSRIYLNLDNLSLIKKIKKTNIVLSKERKILKEYKEAVDRSAIVSKTDKRGFITYVNGEFCRISGYSKDELLGKNHNIVRDPEIPKSFFEEVWSTIKSKQPWYGILKSRTKSGKRYYTDTVINPILDNSGNIVEFISIRNDITDLEKLRYKLKSDLELTNANFEEALTLSREYEKALKESNILIRYSLDGEILYVNQKFCKILGFCKDEFIGKELPITCIDNDLGSIDEIFEKVNYENIFKTVLKLNRKDGRDSYLSTIFVSICDNRKKTIEYMSISQDITNVIELSKEVEETQRELVYRMGEIVEVRSKETGNHVKRVAEYSRLLAQEYGLEKDESDIIFHASPMHDIGKVGIPDTILNKPAKLDKQEWKIMKTHAKMGFNILKNSNRDILKTAAIISYEHHEKYNGKGYPRGLKGEDIHIYGRITAIADVFDALGSDRCYKKAWKLDKILKLFKEERGEHFDPILIDIFFENLDKFLEIRDKYQD